MSDHTNEDLIQARIDIATLKTQVDHLTESLDALQETNRLLAAKVDQMLLTLSEARGGWKTLMLFGSAATTLGAGLTWLFQHFTK